MTRKQAIERASACSDFLPAKLGRAYDLGCLAMARELAREKTKARDNDSFSDWARGYDFGHDCHAKLCREIAQRLARRLKGKG